MVDKQANQSLAELQRHADIGVPIIQSLLDGEQYKEKAPDGKVITRVPNFGRNGSDLIFKHFCPKDCIKSNWINVNNSNERYIAICCKNHPLIRTITEAS